MCECDDLLFGDNVFSVLAIYRKKNWGSVFLVFFKKFYAIWSSFAAPRREHPVKNHIVAHLSVELEWRTVPDCQEQTQFPAASFFLIF